MWLKSYTPRHKRLASLLWWDAMETPGIMRQRDGSRLACFSLESPDLDSALDLELVVQASQLNNLFRRYRKGWGFQTEERRRRVTEYPHPEELDELGKLLYDERVAQWAEGTHLTNDVYLTVVQKPQTDVIKGWRGMVYENLPEVDPAEYSLQEFEEELQRLQGMLKGASIQTTPLEESDLLTYLHSTISAKEHRVLMPEPACYLNTYLTDMDFDPGLYPKLSDGLRTRYFGCVSPHGWTKHTHPGMFDILAELPIEYRACVRNITMDRAEAIKQAEKDANRWESKQTEGRGLTGRAAGGTVTNRAAGDRANSAQEAWRQIEHGEIGYGKKTYTVVVWDETIAGVQRKIQLVENTLNNAGMIAKDEWLNNTEAWLGTIPGNMAANAVQEPMSSYNFAHLFPANNPWKGQKWNSKLNSPPVLYVTGKGRSSVGLSLHEGDVGHFAVVGSTGDGKSTFFNAVCLFLRNYQRHRIRIFDKEYAALKPTAAVQGQWYDLGTMPLQPLANLDLTHEIPWAVDWLEGLMLQERIDVQPRMKKDCFQALQQVAALPKAARTMSSLVRYLKDSLVQETLELYTQAGPYGALTDGNEDHISTNPWLCFELRTLMKTPHRMNAVLPVLMHQLEQQLTGAPTLFVFHEGWVALNTPYWEKHLDSQFRGFRTRNASIGLGSQSLADSVRSNIMPTILDNVVSWIFTPNKQALSKRNLEDYALLQINERQCAILSEGTKKQDYYLKQTSGCARFQLDLGPRALALASTPDPTEVAELQAQIAAWGPDFGKRYLQEKGVL